MGVDPDETDCRIIRLIAVRHRSLRVRVCIFVWIQKCTKSSLERRVARQSHLSGSGLFVPFERSRNSRPPCAHAPIPPHFPGIFPAIGGCGATFLDEAFNMQSPWRRVAFMRRPSRPRGRRSPWTKKTTKKAQHPTWMLGLGEKWDLPDERCHWLTSQSALTGSRGDRSYASEK